MRVLLKDAAAKPNAENILVTPLRTVASLETLSGETAPHGFLAEVVNGTVVEAIEAGAKQRAGEFGFSIREMVKDLRDLADALVEFELGSKFSIKVTGDSWALDESEATRIDRAEGLTREDRVVIGASVTPKTYMNARGRVESIRPGNTVEVELDAGDRDRIERATGESVPRLIKFPYACIEKDAEVKD